MYASPADVAPVAPSRGGLASLPVLAICCLLFILFLIAVTIILALIPIYLPAKNIGAAKSNNVYFNLSPSGKLGPARTLDPVSTQNLANGLDKSLGFRSGSTKLSSAQVVNVGGKRKRRVVVRKRLNRQDRGLSQLIRCIGTLDHQLCGRCEIVTTILLDVVAEILIDGVFESLTFSADVTTNIDDISQTAAAPLGNTASSAIATEATAPTTTSTAVATSSSSAVAIIGGNSAGSSTAPPSATPSLIT